MSRMGYPLTVTLILLFGTLVNSERRIVNGQKAIPDQIPWQVALAKETSSGNQQYCGGVLINEEWVLTAGHCVFDLDRNIYNTVENTFVLIGSLNISGAGGEAIRASKLIKHPDYNNKMDIPVDIGLIKLERAAKLGKPIEFIPDLQYETAGTNLTVSGWGSTTENSAWSRGSDDLMWLTIPAVDYDICQNASEVGEIGRDVYICAGYRHHDSCQGDSGGPLWTTNTQTPYLVGVVSSGTQAKQPLCTGTYGVYTRVYPVKQWISEAQISSASHFSVSLAIIVAITLFLQ